MIYEFSSKETDFALAFALCLDRQKMKEHILIGPEGAVYNRLSRGGGDVYCDLTRPLGELLIGFPHDAESLWSHNAEILKESYQKIFSRWGYAQPAKDCLQRQYAQNDPVRQYLAIQTWREYLKCYFQDHSADKLAHQTNLLYRPLYSYDERQIWDEPVDRLHSRISLRAESSIQLWYPNRKTRLECALTTYSLQPIILYYLQRLHDWKLHIQECKVCGKFFLAKSRRYALCSPKCRTAQATENKRQFDQRAKDMPFEQAYESAYAYWYNRIKRLRKQNADHPERIAALEEAFSNFKAESVHRKDAVKKDQITSQGFIAWLLEQRNVIDRLIEEL
ncbi:hypothetical protein [Ethanoligenens harbinense]|uniref:Uncharacterized protein n=1 Tax=Ethanoligenens harbinense (strain DSM 18485 / JCM 12961 / CGMCC 1.5033 / YUAN-3) TaxID=663278 RepID=E6U3S5_ETHHY|nr:hypothetical protein [Ethanoligenens harbinense]ADU26492.1 hypothetical protein Ethha_0933 [Ethanoligenens harbinense YUAN-3]AYF41028.1 hypothetical protein CN246_04835 [Ethanoligenens harbinense]